MPQHDRWVKEIRRIGKDRYEILCESDDSFILYQREIEAYDIRENAPLSGETYERICDEVLRGRAKSRCMYLLEKQDYSTAQLRRKLSDGRYPLEIIDETIAYFTEMHALDDRRYAENYLRNHRGRYSRRVLEQKLMQRGISQELTAALLEQDDMLLPDEEGQIRAILRKKHYDPENTDPQEKDKIRQMLLRKGFGYDLIRRCT